MSVRRHLAKTCLFSAVAVAAVCSTTAQAAPFVVTLDSSFAAAPISFNFEDSTFTLSSTGDIFNPADITTSGGAAVSAFGGFLGIPVSPTTDFPGRGSGILTYGPGQQFASFTGTTTIPYSNGDNYFGLEATQGGQSYYGYAFTTNTTLNSFAFETTPNTAISINTNVAAVPETATWAMLIMGVGAVGGMMRRGHRRSERKFTAKVRAAAMA